MYTYNNLFDEMTSFENLMRAARNAQRGKRTKLNTARFNFHQESEILQLQQELLTRNYQPGPYRSFYVYEPKRRVISAAPYRDRVVHHALCQIIEPIFESRFIHHSYACRVDKGTHRALDKCQSFIKANQYVLKADIQKFFESINHNVLMDILKRWIKDERVMWLAGMIISPQRRKEETTPRPPFLRGSEGKIPPYERGMKGGCHSVLDPQGHPVGDTESSLDSRVRGNDTRGLPIGNLTSQFFANVYLNELDYFIKFDLREKYYIRYMDDFLVFSNDLSACGHAQAGQKHLVYLKERISEYLVDKLKLTLHDKKSTIFPVKDGVNFLGFSIFRDYRKMLKDNVKRFIKRMKQKAFDYRQGLIGLPDISNSVQSWIAHARYGNTYNLRRKILPQMVF